MLCQSKNVYPYENVQNTIINDSKAKNNENEELQIFQKENYYEKIQGNMLKLKKNQPQKLMTNEEILQEKARRQSFKNSFLTVHYDNLINKNMEYRYGNNLNQQFSFQNYLISQSYNDLLLQQQQQIQQLTTSDMSLQLFQLQNNIINYNSNPSLLFHSIKEPFYANQHYSQIQESAYSPITLSSQAQRPILTSSHQFTNQYSQQVQNLYNNNTFNDIPNINDNVNNNVNNNNKKVTTDNMENIHKISINEKINENLSKSNNKITKKKIKKQIIQITLI